MVKDSALRRLAALAVAAATVTAPVLCSTPTAAAAPSDDTAVYIVRIRGVEASQAAVTKAANAMIATDGGTLRRIYYSVIQGFSVSLTSDQFSKYLHDRQVDSVTPDKTYKIASTQSN